MNSTDLNIKTIKILLVDDRKMIRETVKMQLKSAADLTIVGSAENGIIALQKIEQLQPDIVIIDLEMPGMDGITAIEIISDRFPNTKSLVLSSHDEREYINRAIVAGAKGYLLKGTSGKDLARAIRTIDQGYFQLGSGLLGKLSSNTTLQDRVPQAIITSQLEVAKSDISDLLEINLTNKIEKIINFKINNTHNDLVKLIGQRMQDLAIEQQQTNLKFKRMQRWFYVLLGIQIILFVALIIQH